MMSEPSTENIELMKSLCCGIVGDTARVLADSGFNRPTDTIELIIFAMFIVTETYILAKQRLLSYMPAKRAVAKATEALDKFHLEMFNYVTNKYFLKQHASDDEETLLEWHSQWHDHFYDTIASRYTEYRKLLPQDLNNSNTVYSKILGAFINHVFVESISEDDRPHLIVPMAIKFVYFFTGCLESFKEC